MAVTQTFEVLLRQIRIVCYIDKSRQKPSLVRVFMCRVYTVHLSIPLDSDPCRANMSEFLSLQ